MTPENKHTRPAYKDLDKNHTIAPKENDITKCPDGFILPIFKAPLFILH